MALYCGIDLHSNNHVICVIDDQDKRILEKKLDNDSDLTLRGCAGNTDDLRSFLSELI